MKKSSQHSARAAGRRRRAEDDELRPRVRQRPAELAGANEAPRSEIPGHERADEGIQDLSRFPAENPNPLLRIARNGTLLYINAAGLRQLPQWHLEVGHASLPKLREVAFQSMDSGSTQELDLEHGGRVYSFFVAPIVAAGYADLYGLDITERRRAEERMRALSREFIAALEKERKQVSAVLHHDVGSLVVGVAAHLDAIEADLRSGKPWEALRWTKRIRKLFGASVARLKEVAVQLRPPELDALGLCAALRQHFSRVTKRGGTRIHFRETLGRRRVSGDAATTLFRVAQESLTNAITHGDSTQVDVFLSASKKNVRLTVRDNGKGFSPSKHPARDAPRMGLLVMKEMAASAGGAFTIDSVQRKGTTVRVDLPLRAADSQKGSDA